MEPTIEQSLSQVIGTFLVPVSSRSEGITLNAS
jgi:hypothetical protein